MIELKTRITATTDAREFLAKADPIMGAVIEKYGAIDYELHSDYLNALLSNIVGLLEYSIEQVQQIAFTKSKEDDKRKEATDSSMIIDAMDILYEHRGTE